MDDHTTPIKFTPSKGNYYRSEGTDKPSGSPKSSKDFKRIYDSDDSTQNDPDEAVESKRGDAEAEADVDAIALNYQEGAPIKHVEKAPISSSPFELFAHSTKKPDLKKSIASKQVAPQGLSSSLANADKVENAPQPITKFVDKIDESDFAETDIVEGQGQLIEDHDPLVESKPLSDTAAIVAGQSQQTAIPAANLQNRIASVKPEKQKLFVENKNSKSETFNNQFTRDQPDLSYVNPLAVGMPQNLMDVAQIKTETPLQSVNLQALVEKLVKELSIVTKGDKTETSLVLDNPPQFNGMRIVITRYESANNEFNLKFENLTQAAKEILDLQQNRADLLSNLERKGYNVHIFITTTFAETAPLTTNVETAPREREKQEGKESSRQHKEKNGQAA